MLQIEPTKHLLGITVQGDFNDFREIVDSIYNVVGLDYDARDMYYGVKNRLLGVCYEIRHAYQGDRGIFLIDNFMNDETMKWHGLITPKKNVYYSAEILFPEAIFIAASVPKIYFTAEKYYGSRAKKTENFIRPIPFSDMMRDVANLDVLCSRIWMALGKVIGETELEKIIRSCRSEHESYREYATHYIDKCNIELCKTAEEKRKEKIKNIAKRIVKKPDAYYSMEADLKYWAKHYKTSIYEIQDPDLKYPEDIEW